MSLPDAKPPLSYDDALNGPLPETGALLDAIAQTVRRFVVLSDEQLDAIALWVLHTYAIEAADTTPYLAITSAEKQSGKSRLLELLAQLVARPMEAANISDAALFRAVGGDDGPPTTILFDEIDAVFGGKQAANKEELRGLINAGYRRGAQAYRCVGEGSNQQVKAFPVFGPKALAGIGKLPDTIADRSIPIRLRRRSREEPIERGRYKHIRAATAPIIKNASRWGETYRNPLSESEPKLPEELSDRAQDGAEPLFAIAELAGAEWTERARKSLISLHGDREAEEASWGVRLLADALTVFDAAGDDRLTTTALLFALKEDEEAPWGGWGKSGAGLNARGLGKLLQPYGIHSRSIRLSNGDTPKGYKREQFEDAWSRYLPGTPSRNATPATTALESQKPGLFDPPQESDVADSEPPSNPHSNAVVAGVADREPTGGAGAATAAEEAEAERLAAKFGGAAA